MGGNQPYQNRNANTERVRKVYESINDLNDTIKFAMMNKDEFINGYDRKKVNRHLKIIAKSIDNLADQLKITNQNIARITTTTGIVQMALSGGVDQIINQLSGAIDELHNNIKLMLAELQTKKKASD